MKLEQFKTLNPCRTIGVTIGNHLVAEGKRRIVLADLSGVTNPRLFPSH